MFEYGCSVRNLVVVYRVYNLFLRFRFNSHVLYDSIKYVPDCSSL